jgi:hypothetical protein
VSYRDAQKFRWIVVIVAALPWCAAAIAARMALADVPYPNFGYDPWVASAEPMPLWIDLMICAFIGAASWPVPSIAVVLFFAAITGVASYLFHPRRLAVERQNRAIALSYYACAPLSLMVVACLILALGFFCCTSGLPKGARASGFLRC